MKYIKLLFLILIFISCSESGDGISDTDFESSLDSLRIDGLQKDFNNTNFVASDQFLAWYERATGAICIYSLDSNKIVRKKGIQRGEGPRSAQNLSSLAFHGNDLLMATPVNGRILRYDVKRDTITAIQLEDNVRPQRIAVTGDRVITMNPVAPQGFLKSVDLNTGTVTPWPLTPEEVNSEFDNNFQFLNGNIVVSGRDLTFLSVNRPHMYQFSANDLSMKRKVVFAESEIKFNRNEEGEIYGPPERIDIASRDIYVSPYGDDRFFLKLKGIDDEDAFDGTSIYEYDAQSESFVREISISDIQNGRWWIVSNSERIFIYDGSDTVLYKKHNQ